MTEYEFVGVLLLTLGGIQALRPDWFLAAQIWVQRVLMGAKYVPTRRTTAMVRVMGIGIALLGVLNLTGVFEEKEQQLTPAERLESKSWEWMSVLYNDGTEIRPHAQGAFTLSLAEDGTFIADTDCNQMGGSFSAESDGTIFFTDIFMTERYCEESQEGVFYQLLQDSRTFHFSTNNTFLVLDLRFDSGTVVFK